MKALVVSRSQPDGLEVVDAPDPSPSSDEAIIQIVSTSLNSGEVNRIPTTDVGTIPGWDASGVVLEPAADGSGPSRGTPVVSLAARGGGWAERRASPTAHLAALPAGVDPVLCAALPVAGLTALRVVRRLGDLIGKRVMVVGSSGGVGRFVVQLAARAGGTVVAVASPSSREGLERLGATELVSSPSEVDYAVDFVVDFVGGPLLPRAYASMTDTGRLISVGHSANDAVEFPAGSLVATSRSMEGFYLFADLSGVDRDLAYLLGLIERGLLDTGVKWRGSWRQHEEAVRELKGRRIHGKAVMEID